MKILVTSGGTKVPIDPVRDITADFVESGLRDDITNMSRGTFGAKIAMSFLEAEQSVTYFHAKDAMTPFTVKFDIHKESNFAIAGDGYLSVKRKHIPEVVKLLSKHQQLGRNYKEVPFRNFEDYAENLKSLLKTQPDAVILAAAVSDYITDMVQHKIRSKDELKIVLKHAEKLISCVRELCPKTFLVGFKLLVDASLDQLVSAAQDSIKKNGCDLIVANTWRTDFKSETHHPIWLVWPDGTVTEHTEDQANILARAVVGKITGQP